MELKKVEIDKPGSATSPLDLPKSVNTIDRHEFPIAGDVVVVRALSESVTYGNLELPSGRLAKINRNDILLGVLGKRRALKGFVGDVPDSVKSGDRLHLLNMGGVIGICKGHHSSFSDAIEVEVVGIACDTDGTVLNISDNALEVADSLSPSAPIVMIAGTCMNSGKTVAATEIIRQAANAGLRVAGAKLSGIACLRDTLHMQDHGAVATASFLDCGLPSTVDYGDLSPVAKGILNHLNRFKPDLIAVELGDGIVGGYAVDSVLKDAEIKAAISSFVFCASDYVGVIGGIAVLKDLGIDIDVIAGSVTDSQMGEDFVQEHFGIKAGNAHRNGTKLFELVRNRIDRLQLAFA
ncbi:MAG: hypothetical protein WBD27_16555 [Pyrinomonadaceae bacterium]